MTSETPNLHVSKNLNISQTKQDIEKLKPPLRLAWKCCSVVFKIGSKIFSLQWHFQTTAAYTVMFATYLSRDQFKPGLIFARINGPNVSFGRTYGRKRICKLTGQRGMRMYE